MYIVYKWINVFTTLDNLYDLIASIITEDFEVFKHCAIAADANKLKIINTPGSIYIVNLVIIKLI